MTTTDTSLVMDIKSLEVEEHPLPLLPLPNHGGSISGPEFGA